MAFRWLINADELIPFELPSLRHYVVSTCSRILSAMSRIQLGHIVDIFLQHLAERVNPNPNPKGAAKPNYDLLRNQVVGGEGGGGV